MTENNEKKKLSKFENWLLVVVLLVVLGVTVGPIVAGKLSRGKVMDEGVAAQAKVVLVHDTGDRFNSNPIVSIDLAVVDAAGKEFPATVKMPLSLVHMNKLQAGKMIPVKYDPKDRTKVALVLE